MWKRKTCALKFIRHHSQGIIFTFAHIIKREEKNILCTQNNNNKTHKNEDTSLYKQHSFELFFVCALRLTGSLSVFLYILTFIKIKENEKISSTDNRNNDTFG